MKFNKKLLSLLFVALLAIVLVGCNGEGTTTEAPATDAPTTNAPTTAEPVDFQAAIDELQSEYEDTLESETFEATEDLTLLDSYGDFTFTWSSNNTDYLANDGTVTRPLLSEGTQTVILTVTISQGDESATYDFFVSVKALEEKTPAEIADEVFLFVFAIPSQEFWTSADTLNLVTTGEDEDENEYAVTWTSSHPEYISTAGVITQPEPDEADVDVTLTATITIEGTEFSQDGEFTVAKMVSATEVDDIAAAIALGQDAYVEIPGLTAIAEDSDGNLFFTDGDSILYVYTPSFEVEIGLVYDITGLVDFYYNSPQLNSSDLRPFRTAISTEAASTAPVEATDGVDAVVSDTSQPSSDNPHVYVQYEITASVYYEESWGNYSVFLVPTDYDFDAALATGATQPNGDAIMIYYKSNMDVLESFHGQEITIKITMLGYRTDKDVFYAGFFGETEDVQLSFSNDADAVEAALGLVDFPYSVVENETFDLVTNMYGVTIAYTTSNSTVFNTTTGAVDVSALTVQETITVTATATKGTESDTKTISIKVGPLPTSDISDVIDLPNSDLAQIEGTIVAGGYHNLFFIQDSTGNIALYVNDDDDIELLEDNVGNVVSITGSRSTYNGLNQLNVSEATFVSAGTAVTATNIDGMTLDEAGLLAYQGQLVELTGMVITDVYVDSYDNYQFTLERISDGEEIKLRWDSRYDLPTALMTEVEDLEVGDKITVTTVLSWFRGPQLALVTTIDFTVTALTDADKVALDVRNMETELTLSEDYVVVDGDYGSTISVVEIFGNAANFMDTTTTAGTWAITQPYGTDLMAMVTFTVMSGTVEEMVEVEVTIPGLSLSATISDLIISEYGEGGSGNNKWLEIYNGTGSDVDLTGYKVVLFSNGTDQPGNTEILTGTLEDGETLVLYNSGSIAAVVDAGDIASTISYFNGNDAVALYYGDDVIDVIGVIGEDPADGSWVAGDSTTANDTIIRNSSVLSPNATFTASEWTAIGDLVTTNIGTHEVAAIETTDAMKVNADLAAIDLGGVIKAAQAVALPTTGANGSTIAWTIAEDTDSNATMNVTNDEVTFTEAPADTVEVIKLQATVTMNAETMTGMFVYKVEGVTDVDRVAADKAEVEALELGGDAYSSVSVSLPTTSDLTNGSTITWAITTDADTLATYTAPDLTIARADGTASVVVLTATITKGAASDTLVVTYNMMPEITDLSEVHAMVSDEYVIATGTEIYVVGVITADIYDGLFIQDENGNALFVDDLDGTIGDEVLLMGDLFVNNEVRKLENAVEVSVLSSGNALVYADLTADQIVALDASDAGKLIRFTGIEVVEFDFHATFKVTGTTESVNLGYSYFEGSSNDAIQWLADLYTVGDSFPEATFVFYDFAFGNTRIEAMAIEMTDAQAVQLDSADAPETLELSDDFVIPTSEYGSTYTVTGITGDAAGNIDYTTTPGTLLVTQPALGALDLTGVITVEVAKGTETATMTVDVTVLAELPAPTPELFISEYVEGGGYNKVIEIYNPMDTAADLTGYVLRYYSAGGTTFTELDLSTYGPIASGDVLVLTNSNAAVDPAILAESDDEISFINHNGDDTYELVKDGVVIDSLGVWGDTDWGKDVTLVRVSSIISGNTTYTTSEWDSYAKDELSYVGSHTTD